MSSAETQKDYLLITGETPSMTGMELGEAVILTSSSLPQITDVLQSNEKEALLPDYMKPKVLAVKRYTLKK